jgi:hypothetical protein
LSLCQLANTTTDDAIKRLLIRSFISSNLLTKIEFNDQVNGTINQFIQSTISNFALLVDTVHLLTQVDQPFSIIDGYKLSVINSVNNNYYEGEESSVKVFTQGLINIFLSVFLYRSSLTTFSIENL